MVGNLIRRRLAISLALASLGLAAGAGLLAGAHATEAVPVQTPDAAVASGRLIVAFPRTALDEDQARAILARHGARLERWLPELGLARAVVSAGAEPTAVAALVDERVVEFVTEERRSVLVAEAPLDEFWTEQWGPEKVALPSARHITWGDPSVVIAVVDTGVNYWHWDLRDQIWINPGESEIDLLTGKPTCNTGIAQNGADDDGNGYVDDCRGYNFDAGDNNPSDVFGHGTAVAGIAAAATNNLDPYISGGYEGIAGMGGAARLMVLRAMDADGGGSPFNIAEAIRYAADNGAQVINLSLTLRVNYIPAEADTLCRATEYAQSRGALVVGASGNHSSASIVYPVSFPAACPGVLAVGASTRSDTRTNFSDAGARLDLVAPGEGIFTTLRTSNQSYGRWDSAGSGTSFAAPHVAGAAALVRGLRPDLSPGDVGELIRVASDDVAAPGFDAATGWGRLNAGTAVANALAGLTLSVLADPPGVAVGGQTQVRVQVLGPAGAPAGFGARAALSAALGVVSPTLVTVDDAGLTTTMFTAGETTGQGHVTATLGSLSASIPLTISSGIPISLSLSATPPLLPIGGRATVIASVRDDGGNQVGDGFDVTFSATRGLLDPLTAKTSAGKASTDFTAGAMTGEAVIQATLTGLKASLIIPVLGAGEPFTVTVNASSQQAQAGGPDLTLTATVVDSGGLVVPDGTVVEFSANPGAVAPQSTTTKAGQASVKFVPGTSAGLAKVVARSGLVQGEFTVAIVAGSPTAVAVTADPEELIADLNQLSSIRAVAKDQYGNTAADGVIIQFATTLGLLVSKSALMQGGRAEVQLLGGLVAGIAQVMATAPGGAHGSVSVTIRPNAPALMDLIAQPNELTVGGGASRLRATVKDAHGNLVANGAPVTFTTNLGQLRVAGGSAAGGLTIIGYTSDGVAQADLVPGTVAGVAEVRAAISPELHRVVGVTLKPGAAAQLILSAEPSLVGPNGRVDIAAHVFDRFGNPAPDGIDVVFGVNRGQLHQSVVSTKDGVAYTWFTAPSTPGPIQVVAVAGGVSGSTSVRVASRLYLPLIDR